MATSSRAQSLNTWFAGGASALLSAADERQLAEQARAGGAMSKAARDQLVRSNLRLVISIARGYASPSLPLDDLIQEGTLGLMRAAVKFDGARGVRFATYANWWIRQAVARARDTQIGVIRIPSYKAESIQRLARTQSHLRRRYSRAPSALETARFMGIDVSQVEALMATRIDTVELDAPISAGVQPIHERIEDPTVEAVGARLDERELRQALDDALASLSDREEEVIRLRFAYGHHKHHSLREIGELFGVSRERIRQLEARALIKLRHASRSAALGLFTL